MAEFPSYLDHQEATVVGLVPIGHPAMPIDALLRPRTIQDGQTPSLDDHFAGHMSLCAFPVGGDPGYTSFDVMTGGYQHFSGRVPPAFLSSWSPPGSSIVMAQRQVEYFPGDDDNQLCFSGDSPSCSPTLEFAAPGQPGSQWGPGFYMEDTSPVASAMNQREGVCGHPVLSNQLTFHVPPADIRPEDNLTTPENDQRARNAKEIRGRVGTTGDHNKKADRLRKGTIVPTRAETSSTGEGSSSTTEEACQSPPIGRAALRTAPRKKKRTKTTTKKGESPREERARTSHNMVEKEYRDRLRQYFEALLLVLPQEVAGLEEDEQANGGTLDGNPVSSSVEGQQKKLSKADVLAKACHHIEQLEYGTRQQRLELDMLREALEGA